VGVRKRNVVEMERFAHELLKNEYGFSEVKVLKDVVTIFVATRMLYEEIQEVFESFGYKVQCGRKRFLSK
jgi:hypothetical protein